MSQSRDRSPGGVAGGRVRLEASSRCSTRALSGYRSRAPPASGRAGENRRRVKIMVIGPGLAVSTAALACALLGVGSAEAPMAQAVHAPSTRAAIDLGTLGGASSAAVAVNDRGVVVGTSETASGAEHAFAWSRSGGMRDLGTLGGRTSRAVAVNQRGTVTGVALRADGEERAFVWTPGHGMRDLGTLGAVSPQCHPCHGPSLVHRDSARRAPAESPQVAHPPGPAPGKGVLRSRSRLGGPDDNAPVVDRHGRRRRTTEGPQVNGGPRGTSIHRPHHRRFRTAPAQERAGQRGSRQSKPRSGGHAPHPIFDFPARRPDAGGLGSVTAQGCDRAPPRGLQPNTATSDASGTSVPGLRYFVVEMRLPPQDQGP